MLAAGYTTLGAACTAAARPNASAFRSHATGTLVHARIQNGAKACPPPTIVSRGHPRVCQLDNFLDGRFVRLVYDAPEGRRGVGR